MFELYLTPKSRIQKFGIPSILRGEVWPSLVSETMNDFKKLENEYRIQVSKISKFQREIANDISRTFPTHPKFTDERGQMELLRVLKAYSNYDVTVGYCQGMNFIVATLLVQMPEETAFAVFTCLMFRLPIKPKSSSDQAQTQPKPCPNRAQTEPKLSPIYE